MSGISGHSKPTGKLLLPLNTASVVFFLGVLVTIAALIQLPLGADPVVLAIAMASTGLGLFAFLALGAYNLGAWVALLYTLGNVMVALYAKTALGQPLDSHLSTPVMSFLVLLAIDTAMTLYTLAAATSLIGERPGHSCCALRILGLWCIHVHDFPFGNGASSRELRVNHAMRSWLVQRVV